MSKRARGAFDEAREEGRQCVKRACGGVPRCGVASPLLTACEELNALLAGESTGIGNERLIGMHTFVRKSHAEVFIAWAGAQGLPAPVAAAVAAGSPPPRCAVAPEAFGLLRMVLGGAFQHYAEASITEYTVIIPPALIAWASRWEIPVERGVALRLLEVQAFCARGGGGCAARPIWLPVWA
ncbi:hypothetical protein Rsub_06705 [Raphidocelis subcapitata]|uniref:Uncharacterized protein n=1 Tax=Raphidocelis subcapitata TaxID=307507 RepID=A0A2V0P9Q9_9CHLO|nr:hypothetical protein Rsub_06705 [Raphidocelis subcapitata]|eukprot:GBF94590.1 hypothetical protein Rsub_06705 [Raphidocelis subcapitata]